MKRHALVLRTELIKHRVFFFVTSFHLFYWICSIRVHVFDIEVFIKVFIQVFIVFHGDFHLAQLGVCEWPHAGGGRECGGQSLDSTHVPK